MPCENVKQCALVKGTEPAIKITMTPPGAVTKLTTVVHGQVYGASVPFPLGQKADACKNAHLTCPLEAGKEVLYNFSLPVAKYYPSVSFIVFHILC